MAILMQATTPGLTAEGYDAIASEQLFSAMAAFEGYGGFHAAGPVDGGWLVSEIWDSEEAHQTWVRDVVAPNMPGDMASGMQVNYFPLHNIES